MSAPPAVASPANAEPVEGWSLIVADAGGHSVGPIVGLARYLSKFNAETRTRQPQSGREIINGLSITSALILYTLVL
jgi:hypothetical protein